MSVFETIIPGGEIQLERNEENAHVAHISFKTDGYDVLAHVFLPHTAPAGAVPICGSLYNGERQIWKFNKEFLGRVHLLMVCDMPMLVFVGKDSRKVERVVPVITLLRNDPVGLKKSVRLKLAAAQLLECDCAFHGKESIIAAVMRQERTEDIKRELEEQAAQRQAEAERRRRQREAKILAIKGREQYALTDGSRNLYGVPVEDDEWQILPDGTWVALVEGYDSETGRCTQILEHFVVSKKKGANAAKKAVTTNISFKEDRWIDPPTPQKTVLMEVGDDFYEVPLYASKEDLELLVKLKIPGWFAIQAQDGLAVGKVTVSAEGKAVISRVEGARLVESLVT